MLTAMEIRFATADDWPGIWPFLREIVSAGETYTWPRDVDEARARQMWLVPPPGRTVVAVDPDGTVLGSAKLTPNQLGPGDHVANASFMVAGRAAGRGIGRALGMSVLDLARADGYRAMQFNAVVASNTRAVGLWRSLGFEVVGRIPAGFHHPSEGYVDLLVMYQRL
ncbi:N-acetyltransferase [Micromonospora phaseoli]|nr:N-acetyltransferase [Micromonospora phaseoli]